MSKGVASKTSKSSEGVGVGDASTTCKKVSKLVVSWDRGERPVRERTRGVAGTKSVGSGGRLTEGEQEIDPLRVSRSANKGKMLSEAPAGCTLHHTLVRGQPLRQQVVGGLHSVLRVRQKLLQVFRPPRRIEPSSVGLTPNRFGALLSVKVILIRLKGVLHCPAQVLSVPERTKRKLSRVHRNL